MVIKQTRMSISINFGSAPKAIYWFGDIAPEIWDMIWTWKDLMEKKEKQEYILQSQFQAIETLMTSKDNGFNGEVRWRHEQLQLENMLKKLTQDMAVLDITPTRIADDPFLNKFYKRFPYKVWSKKCPDVWGGKYPPRM